MFDFDADATGFDIKKGVLTNEAEREVYAPVAMWLQAIDAVLRELQTKGMDFDRVRGISGAGQQVRSSGGIAPSPVPHFETKNILLPKSTTIIIFRLKLEMLTPRPRLAWQCLLEYRRREGVIESSPRQNTGRPTRPCIFLSL